MSEMTPIKPISFACPKCKRPLRSGDNTLHCGECNRTYPITGGIPDFLVGNSRASLAPVRRMAKGVDLLAPIYESRLWYVIVEPGWSWQQLPFKYREFPFQDYGRHNRIST
jgi:hypothetical protein